MRFYISLIIFFLSTVCLSQRLPEEFGFQHVCTMYQSDTVHVLIKSKKGEEKIRKPLFLFCQGSMPVPLIITRGDNSYGTFPFDENMIIDKYHIAIISKPNIPLVVEDSVLGQGLIYIDISTGKIPEAYLKRNMLDYYVDRNTHVISYLLMQPFVDKDRIVVAGHSQGSTIAAKMSMKSPLITHLIYSAGNPMGQVMSMISQSRKRETKDKMYSENEFKNWEYMILNKDSLSYESQSTMSFSTSYINEFDKIKIPVLVCYGSVDYTAPFNDYLRVETIRGNLKNIDYKTYKDRDHNFFGLTNEGRVNNDDFGWDIVSKDWLNWLKDK